MDVACSVVLIRYPIDIFLEKKKFHSMPEVLCLLPEI